MRSIAKWFAMRPLRLLGGFMVFISTGLLLFFVLLDITSGLANPYVGMFAYLVLPGMLALGLALVPFDTWLQRRRRARGKPSYPVFDLCDPHQRRLAAFFGVASTLILIVGTVVSYKSVEFMGTKTFCGRVCHRVMSPELTAYERSAHASVECVSCHIGPGASWFVRSKLSGLPQVLHYTTGHYDRPLKTPVRALRPSRDTCENCHWPQKLYGSLLRTTITYQQDRANTRDISTMVMRVGSGGVPGSGIHSHIVGRIDYLPAVGDFKEIAWVRIKRADGSSQEFVNPAYKDKLSKLRANEHERRMDCIDCHNRAAHDFEPFEKLVDDAITRGKVDISLPFIKREAMNAVGELEKAPTEKQQARTVKRVMDIERFYARSYPELYKTQQEQVERSVKAIRDAYLGAAFPLMKVCASTYPNWRTHDGCFRCHGVLESASPKGRDPGISGDCNLCHSDQTSSDPSKLFAGDTR